MKISRRIFFSLLFFSARGYERASSKLLAQSKTQREVDVSVMEVFSSSSAPSALLVHHADEATRETFAAWVRTNSGKAITCKLRDKTQTSARIFRVSLCFGRGLILSRTTIAGVRTGDVLRLTLE